MSEVKRLQRYSRDFNGNLSKDPNGDWILFGDAAEREGILTGKIGAQRLRADTAEAERNALKDEVGQAKGEYDRAANKLAAAEERIAELVTTFTPLIKNWDDLAAGESVNVDRARAALKPNPEAESHEKH